MAEERNLGGENSYGQRQGLIVGPALPECEQGDGELAGPELAHEGLADLELHQGALGGLAAMLDRAE